MRLVSWCKNNTFQFEYKIFIKILFLSRQYNFWKKVKFLFRYLLEFKYFVYFNIVFVSLFIMNCFQLKASKISKWADLPSCGIQSLDQKFRAREFEWRVKAIELCIGLGERLSKRSECKSTILFLQLQSCDSFKDTFFSQNVNYL